MNKNKLLKLGRKIRYLFYSKWNKILFNFVGIKYGRNLKVYNKIYLSIGDNSNITIGDNFTFRSGESFNPLSRNIRGCIKTFRNATLNIGNNVGISSACIWAKENITIGNNVLIGGDCILLDTDSHNIDYKIRKEQNKIQNGDSYDEATAISKPIIIEDDVLIGTRCIILKGVTIGACSVIGSGSVVTKSIPSHCIAAGNPCKIIRYIE